VTTVELRWIRAICGLSVLIALALAIGALAPASAQEDVAGAREPATVEIYYNLHSLYALEQDPGRFILRGVLSVEYDLEALSHLIDIAALRPGRYDQEAAEQTIEATGLPDIVIENQSEFTTISSFLFITSNKKRAILNHDFEVAIRPSASYWNFPFDRQRIPLIFTVLGYTSEDVKLSPGEGAIYSVLGDLKADRQDNRLVAVKPALEENLHRLEGSFLLTDVNVEQHVQEVPDVGLYSVLVVEFFTERSFTTFFLVSFLPTLLLMGLVSIAPWLSDLKMMDLLRLSATVTLAIFATMIAFEDQTPDGNFITVMDVFQVGAVTFVFLVSLSEFLRRQYTRETQSPGGRTLVWVNRIGSLTIYILFWIVVLAGSFLDFGADV